MSGIRCLLTTFFFCSIDGPSPKTLAAVGGLHNLISLPDFALVAVARDSVLCYAEPDGSNKLGASFQTPFGRRLVGSYHHIQSCMMNIHSFSMHLSFFYLGILNHHALQVTTADYMNIVNAMQPDIWTSLPDEVPCSAGSKRNKLSIERTLRWLDQCIASQKVCYL